MLALLFNKKSKPSQCNFVVAKNFFKMYINYIFDLLYSCTTTIFFTIAACPCGCM